MYAGTQFGRYEIRSKIGEGGMGEVYSALDQELDRSVAIKLLPTEFTADADRKSRFRQEAKVVSSLNHPNIITIYEIGENEHGSFLATEFVEGRTLREIIKHESLTLPRILRIVEQTANALVAAHQAGIVHRDIKPENIMVRQDLIVKVLDFGLAKPISMTNDDNSSENKTLPGTVMGSARYMSPEQARGREVDARTDVWSLGVVLYEMLIGRVPFDGETTADTIAAVVYKEPEPLGELMPNLPPELMRIVRKALQKDRDERYQDIRDLALDIKELLSELEHANSGGRSGASISSPNFSENPTMIHRTVSADHRTEGHTAAASGAFSGAVSGISQAPVRSALGALAVILLLTVLALGFYSWYGSGSGLAADAFARPQITRIDTDGHAMLPAMSPDGKYVAYVSGEFGSRSLVVRQLATDSTITLVPATNLNLQSISFSPSGDHVYFTETNSDQLLSTLYQVPTLGGSPKKLVEDVDGAITFSPDAKRFAFIRYVPKTNSDVVVVVDAETLERSELISTAGTDYHFFVNRLAWSPDGEFILAGAGHRQSGFVTGMDVVSIPVAGGGVRALNTRQFFTVNNMAWFADGSGFVFTGRVNQNDPTQIWLATYPGGELHQVTNDFNDYLDLGIAADGKTIVTVKGDTTGSLWKYSIADKTAVQLTSDSRNTEGKYGVIQRPDGSLLFTRSAGKEADIWQADAEGKNAEVFFKETGFSIDPVLTRDGRFIVFNLQKDKQSRIWRMNADGTGAVPLTEENPDFVDFSPQVTPDGKTVIFQRQIANQDRFKLMKVSIDGGTAEVFYESETRGVFNPRISPDGERIAFTSYDLATFGKQLHVASLDGAAFGRIEHDIEHNLINGFMWSPDSSELTILTNRGGVQNLWRQPLDGGPATQITDFKSGRIFNFQWAPDGRSLLIARGSTTNDLIVIRDSPEDGPAVTRWSKARDTRRQTL
jgi:serine/threonine protein kinase